MTEVTGTDRLRDALKARNSKINLSLFAKDLGLSGDQIHSFITGGDLMGEQKRAIAEYLWPHIEYNAELDVLQPSKREAPRSMGGLPEFNLPLPKYQSGPPGVGPQPVKPPDPKPKKREGWLGGWF